MIQAKARGSSKLDDDARKVWQERFGERYVQVPQEPFKPARRQRRRRRKPDLG